MNGGLEEKRIVRIGGEEMLGSGGVGIVRFGILFCGEGDEFMKSDNWF